MTPKEKAEELADNMSNVFCGDIYKKSNEFDRPAIKQCALKAVEEILKAIDYESPRHEFTSVWWLEVKNEIEKL